MDNIQKPKDIKKTATLTFQNSENYGASLQAYALQQSIFKIGIKNEVLNYQSNYMSKPYSFSALKRKGMLRYLLGIAYFFVRIPRKTKFREFRNYIKMSPPLSCDNLNSIENKYDAFIAGSDQIWNDSLTNFDSSYYLDFVKSPEKKLSYAASFGFENIPDNLKLKYKDLLNDFSIFNMREESGVKNINQLLGRPANLVLDPTMLLTKDDWNKVGVFSRRKYKYILVYQTTVSSVLIKTVKKLAFSSGYRVICIPFPLGGFIKSKLELRAGPREWIGLIRDAEIVVTDSFHGLAFSIIYNKNFYVCITEQATRIYNLLNIFQLKDRICTQPSEALLTNEINWKIVNTKLNLEREISLLKIKEMLEV